MGPRGSGERDAAAGRAATPPARHWFDQRSASKIRHDVNEYDRGYVNESLREQNEALRNLSPKENSYSSAGGGSVPYATLIVTLGLIAFAIGAPTWIFYEAHVLQGHNILVAVVVTFIGGILGGGFLLILGAVVLIPIATLIDAIRDQD